MVRCAREPGAQILTGAPPSLGSRHDETTGLIESFPGFWHDPVKHLPAVEDAFSDEEFTRSAGRYDTIVQQRGVVEKHFVSADLDMQRRQISQVAKQR